MSVPLLVPLAEVRCADARRVGGKAAALGELLAAGFPVLDEGAMTQHAATTAREYGVPCIIRTHNATHRIPDDAHVVVDGAAGTIEIELAPEHVPGAPRLG